MTVSEWIQMAQVRLASAGIESVRLESHVLAGHVLLVDRSWLLAHGDEPFPDLAGEQLLQRRECHEPLSYIVGGREFYGRWYSVNPSVLIPRQDTETLVEAAVEFIDATEISNLNVLDVGTGSGAIAITLKLERPAIRVTGIDLSKEALETAQQNGEALGAEVRWIGSDLFGNLGGESFDLIVTNPPYIANDETLDRDVVDFEPHLALFSGPTGLEFYERLAAEAGRHLASNGMLMMEVGHTQAHEVRSLFTQAGWRNIQIRRDLAGVDRVVVADFMGVRGLDSRFP